MREMPWMKGTFPSERSFCWERQSSEKGGTGGGQRMIPPHMRRCSLSGRRLRDSATTGWQGRPSMSPLSLVSCVSAPCSKGEYQGLSLGRENLGVGWRGRSTIFTTTPGFTTGLRLCPGCSKRSHGVFCRIFSKKKGKENIRKLYRFSESLLPAVEWAVQSRIRRGHLSGHGRSFQRRP